MYQQTTILGRLGRTPELRFTSDETPVCNFSVAVNRKSRQGEQTTWFRVSCFGRLAELCVERLQKGSMALVIGWLESDPKTGSPRIWLKEGESRANFDLVANTVRFI